MRGARHGLIACALAPACHAADSALANADNRIALQAGEAAPRLVALPLSSEIVTIAID